MSSLLTWHRSAANSPALSTYANTLLGLMQQLDAALQSFEAESGSHWEICSSNLSTNPYYITLKRKTGSAGRIMFMGFTGSVSPFNPQLQNYTNGTNQINVVFFPAATSDTPANINSASGDVFTNPGNSTGLSASWFHTTATHVLRLFDHEDGIIIATGTTTNAFLVGAGLLVDDVDEVAGPAVFRFTGPSPITANPPIAIGSIAVSSNAIVASDAVGRFVLGNGLTYDSNFATSLNDTATKNAYFLPVILSSRERLYQAFATHKFRQIAFGYTPTASDEILVTSGPTDVAFHVAGPTTAGANQPWLTNFKV